MRKDRPYPLLPYVKLPSVNNTSSRVELPRVVEVFDLPLEDGQYDVQSYVNDDPEDIGFLKKNYPEYEKVFLFFDKNNYRNPISIYGQRNKNSGLAEHIEGDILFMGTVDFKQSFTRETCMTMALRIPTHEDCTCSGEEIREAIIKSPAIKQQFAEMKKALEQLEDPEGDYPTGSLVVSGMETAKGRGKFCLPILEEKIDLDIDSPEENAKSASFGLASGAVVEAYQEYLQGMGKNSSDYFRSHPHTMKALLSLAEASATGNPDWYLIPHLKNAQQESLQDIQRCQETNEPITEPHVPLFNKREIVHASTGDHPFLRREGGEDKFFLISPTISTKTSVPVFGFSMVNFNNRDGISSISFISAEKIQKNLGEKIEPESHSYFSADNNLIKPNEEQYKNAKEKYPDAFVRENLAAAFGLADPTVLIEKQQKMQLRDEPEEEFSLGM